MAWRQVGVKQVTRTHLNKDLAGGLNLPQILMNLCQIFVLFFLNVLSVFIVKVLQQRGEHHFSVQLLLFTDNLIKFCGNKIILDIIKIVFEDIHVINTDVVNYNRPLGWENLRTSLAFDLALNNFLLIEIWKEIDDIVADIICVVFSQQMSHENIEAVSLLMTFQTFRMLLLMFEERGEILHRIDRPLDWL